MGRSIASYQTEWPALLSAARGGDDAALGQMCERLREYLLLMTADDLGGRLQAKLGASDIVQEAMLEACRDFDSFRGDSEAEFRAWIKRLVHHNLIDSARSFRQAQSRDVAREAPVDGALKRLELGGDAKTASSIVRRRETDEELMRAVARLPENRRRIVELRHRDGRSYAEIAKELKMTEAAARKLWSRTLESLRNELTDDGQSPKRRIQAKKPK